MAVGVTVVGVWARLSGAQIWPRPSEWRPLFLLGVLFTVQIGLLNSASELTSPSYGVVILNAYPVFVNLVGHFWRGNGLEERLTVRRVAGLALALAGLAVLTMGRAPAALAPHPLLGNLMMVASAFLLGYRQVYTRLLVQSIDPVRTVVWQMAWSVPLFLAIAAATEPMVYGSVSWQALTAISYQGFLVAGFCFIIWAELLKKHEAGRLTMFAFLVPAAGIALSGWIFGEPLTAGLVVGGALALAGVFLVTREG
jgi:drug/metabolite transporter (DMT)-like permease